MKRILTIAGSDSSGGAGIQADIKTISALGGYAMSAITAITAQNTLGVQAVQAMSAEMVAQQITSCLSDIGADAIKLGMLANANIINAVKAVLSDSGIPIILDPVMVATSGDRLLDDTALNALMDLMQHASLITPNIPEAETLTGLKIDSQDTMFLAAHTLAKMTGGTPVLLKGGHLQGEELYDLLYQAGEVFWYESPRINSLHTHGTGCTLASAIATIGAQGNPLFKSVELARDYVHNAIKTAPEFGKGNGPLNHLK